MVVPQNAGGVDGNDTQEGSAAKGHCETFCLLLAAGLTSGTASVQGPQGVGDGSGGGENELELQDVELSEGDSEEQSVVGRADGECDELAEVWAKLASLSSTSHSAISQEA